MPRSSCSALPVDVPLGYPTATLFLDESGSKASASQFFVTAAVKLRAPGMFQRTIRELRDRTGFEGEFKFAEITRGTLPAYYELIDKLEESDALLAACVVDGQSSCNPFAGGRPAWLAHAEVAVQLLVGVINRRELVTVMLDGISTPRGCSLEDHVKDQVNRRLRNTSVIGAVCLDSRSSDVLQVADMLAGAIAFERRRGATGDHAMSNKAKVATRLQAAFGLRGLHDQRSARTNIATYRGRAAAPRPARAVDDIPRQGLRTFSK